MSQGILIHQTSTLIFLAGNVLQAIGIIVFASFVLVIKKRVNRVLANANPNTDYPLSQPLLNQVLISVGLFLVRLIVRVAQGAQGLYEYAVTREWVFGVFEYLVSGILFKSSWRARQLMRLQPIFLILVLWAVKPLFTFLFPHGQHRGASPTSHREEANDKAATAANV